MVVTLQPFLMFLTIYLNSVLCFIEIYLKFIFSANSDIKIMQRTRKHSTISVINNKQDALIPTTYIKSTIIVIYCRFYITLNSATL